MSAMAILSKMAIVLISEDLIIPHATFPRIIFDQNIKFGNHPTKILTEIVIDPQEYSENFVLSTLREISV